MSVADFASAYPPVIQQMPAEVRYMNAPSVAANAPSLRFVANSEVPTLNNKDPRVKPRKDTYNQVPGETVTAKWGIAKKLYGESGAYADAAKAYDIAIPEVGARNTDYAKDVPYQGKSSPVFKAETNYNLARPLAALCIGFFVGSAGTLAIFRFTQG